MSSTINQTNPIPFISSDCDLPSICKDMRRKILKMTTVAGSGHPTSSMSGVELMATLLLSKKYFQCDWSEIDRRDNDKLIFSKGHASPLFYSLFNQLGLLSDEELWTYRKFDSVLEGHPTPRFRYTEATTGSLGQGLGIGLGMAFAKRVDKSKGNIWVLLGDSELAEGSVWETMQVAAHHKMSNLIAVVDMNRLGQQGETMTSWDTQGLKQRVESVGFEVIVVDDGHDIDKIKKALNQVLDQQVINQKPIMLIAKTIKGKGVSFLENQEGWHGKVLNSQELEKGLQEI